MTSTGLIVAAAVLTIGVAVGLWRRRTDGLLRSAGVASGSRPSRSRSAGGADTGVSGHDELDGGVVSVAEEGDGGTVAVAGLSQPGEGGVDPSAAGARLDPGLLAALGVEPARATLLQFSSAFCAPCRSLRRVSSEVAALLPGVSHVEVDAESHLDAVRALGIWRTPTLLVLDENGRVVKRATGVPAKPQLIAVLGEILPAV
jgi:thiol-disulfide isomerase/thioredoxin